MGLIKEIIYTSEAREKMMTGVTKLANAVKVTLGPRGRNVIIENPYGGQFQPHITKDGVTVAKCIFLKDTFENVGCQMIKKIALQTSQQAGDGTTTATVLGQSILQEGIKAVAAGMNPMDLKRGIDKAVNVVIEDLKRHSKPIATDKDIYDVAVISSNGDKEIGDLLMEAFAGKGKDRQLTLTEGKELQTQLEITKGLFFDQGFESTLYVQGGRVDCTLDNPLIFVNEHEFKSNDAISPILAFARNEQRPLLFISHSCEHSALTTVVNSIKRENVQWCTVKAPAMGDYRKDHLNDIALLTGGKLLPLEEGNKLQTTIDRSHFGEAEQVIVTKNRTTIIGGKGDPERIAEHERFLKDCIEKAKHDPYATEESLAHLRSRLANICGMALIRAGGSNDIEMKERKDRIEDSMHATRAAIDEGILPGGGVALLRSIAALDVLHEDSNDINMGIRIVKNALKEPIRQIVINAGLSSEEVINAVLKESVYTYGFDAQNFVYGDLVQKGIVDPTKVVRLALQDAASIAGLMITTESIIGSVDENPVLPMQSLSLPYPTH